MCVSLAGDEEPIDMQGNFLLKVRGCRFIHCIMQRLLFRRGFPLLDDMIGGVKRGFLSFLGIFFGG